MFVYLTGIIIIKNNLSGYYNKYELLVNFLINWFTFDFGKRKKYKNGDWGITAIHF